MKALFDQFPFLLPALGIVGAASLLALFWLGLGFVGERLHRSGPTRHRVRLAGIEMGSGGAYESDQTGCKSGNGTDPGGDCGGDGGGGGD